MQFHSCFGVLKNGNKLYLCEKLQLMKIAVFPGSFDPITAGHEDLIKRAASLFDHIIVAIGENSQKKYLFPLDQRLNWLEEVFEDFDNISVDSYVGLTVRFCKEKDANFIVRGLRNSNDFEYEKQISQLNNIIGEGVETAFLVSRPEYSHISSSIVYFPDTCSIE